MPKMTDDDSCKFKSSQTGQYYLSLVDIQVCMYVSEHVGVVKYKCRDMINFSCSFASLLINICNFFIYGIGEFLNETSIAF